MHIILAQTQDAERHYLVKIKVVRGELNAAEPDGFLADSGHRLAWNAFKVGVRLEIVRLA